MNELTTDLSFKVDFKPSEITIQNERQLKDLVDKLVKHYNSLLFTDDSIQEAKKAKADLNNIAKLLDEQRKAVKKEYNAPLKEFELKINSYTKLIKETSETINQSVSAYEKAEKDKRQQSLQATINEIAPNYKIEANELEINPTWLNKGSFTTKGEVNKKTLEDITFQMKHIYENNERIAADKAIIGNYAKAVGLDPESWVNQIDNGLYVTDLMKRIDEAVVAKREREDLEQAIKAKLLAQQQKDEQVKQEYEQAMKELSERQANEKTVDVETGEIIVNNELECQEIEDFKEVTLRLSGTHKQLSALNEFIVSKGIFVEVM